MANRSIPGPPSLAALFLCFLTIGSTSFGGGLLGWIRRELVEKRGWLDDQQFLVVLRLSQIVPGATNVNLAVLIGTQLRGVPGALAASPGCCWFRWRSCWRWARFTSPCTTCRAAD